MVPSDNPVKSWPIELDQLRLLMEILDDDVEDPSDHVNTRYVAEIPFTSDVFSTSVLFNPIVSLGFGESAMLGG